MSHQPTSLKEKEENEIMIEYKKRQQWFIARIGKRVFRNQTSCPCVSCTGISYNGLIISDEMHADYLHMIECDFNAEGHAVRYFDTLEDAKEFENNLKS